MARVVNRTTKETPAPMSDLQKLQNEVRLQKIDEAHKDLISRIEAQTLIANLNHWFNVQLPPLIALAGHLPGLLPLPSDNVLSDRIILGLAHSRNEKSEEMTDTYISLWEKENPITDQQLADAGMTRDDLKGDALSYAETVAQVTASLVRAIEFSEPNSGFPFTLDELLVLASKHTPAFDLGFWKSVYGRLSTHGRETTEQQEDDKQTRASELLAAMEFGVAYSISDFVGEGKLYTSDRYCRKVMGSLVDSGKVTKLGDKKGTRYTLAGGEIRTVETPPNIFPAKKGD